MINTIILGELKAIEGRIIVEVDMQSKNFVKFIDGTKIILERDYENLDKKYTQPVQGRVISAKDIPEGSTILFHHNATHDTYRVFNYKGLSGLDIASDIRYFSIEYKDCYLWSNNIGEWNPAFGFATGLRVFEPYNGILHGIEPKLIKNVLYITSGNLKGKVCHTLRASDYEIVFNGEDGREKRIIRLRHWEDEENDREEIVAIDHVLTKKVNAGNLLIGLRPFDAKELNKVYA